MDTNETTARKKPGPKPRITVTPRSEEATWSQAEIIARRLSGEPFGLKQDGIPMKEPGKWAVRIANSQLNESRHYDMVHKLGYQPMTKDFLPDGITPESLGLKLAEDGQTLCRGIRGDEVFYVMPKDVHDRIQFAKAESNVKGQRSEKAAKHEAAEAIVGAHGDEAADYISKSHITIKDTRGSL